MRVGAIVLARLDSRRLPAKALRALHGRPLVRWAFDICVATRGVDHVSLATTDRPEDDELARYAESCGVAVFRGDCDDVAGRFLAAMERFELDAALRLNGDSPLNRPLLLGEAVEQFCRGDADLVTNVPGRSYPFGVSAEVVGRPAMRSALRAMTDPAHREHVTKLFYDHPQSFRVRTMKAEEGGMSGVQLAVDDATDLARADFILANLREPPLEAPLSELVRLAVLFERRMEQQS